MDWWKNILIFSEYIPLSNIRLLEMISKAEENVKKRTKIYEILAKKKRNKKNIFDERFYKINYPWVSHIKNIANKWGIEDLKNKQIEAINLLLFKQNITVLLPTGYGKSLIWLLYSQILFPKVLIIIPLISIAMSQLDFCNKHNINASFNSIDGQIVYVTPEYISINSDYLQHFELIIFDEAQCLISWGSTFRPSYQSFYELAKNNNKQFALFSGSLLNFNDTLNFLSIKNSILVKEKFTLKKNLQILYKKDFKDCLNKNLKGIIFMKTKKECEDLFFDGFNTISFYSDVYDKDNKLAKIINGEFDLIISTIALSMGVDFDIDYVIMNFYADKEELVQKLGRIGRRGRQSYLFFLKDNFKKCIQREIYEEYGLDEDCLNCFKCLKT